MTKIQVGFSKITDPKTGNLRVCKYSDVPTKLDKLGKPTGWVENLNFLPIPFDLMYLSILDKDKPISGWWTGQNWDGLRFKEEYKVFKWKRNIDND